MATGPIETHLHHSFNWENGAPGSRIGPRGRSVNCGSVPSAQCVRLRSEINPFLHLETKHRPSSFGRCRLVETAVLLPIGSLILQHILNKHAGTNTLKVPLASPGQAYTVCKLAAIIVITRNDLDKAIRIQTVDCSAGTIRRNPYALGECLARETVRHTVSLRLPSDLHQHQHLDTLHIVDTRTTLARHGSLLKPSTSIKSTAHDRRIPRWPVTSIMGSPAKDVSTEVIVYRANRFWAGKRPKFRQIKP